MSTERLTLCYLPFREKIESNWNTVKFIWSSSWKQAILSYALTINFFLLLDPAYSLFKSFRKSKIGKEEAQNLCHFNWKEPSLLFLIVIYNKIMLLCIYWQKIALYMFPEIDYSHSNYYIFSYLIHCVIKITNIEGFYFELKTIVGRLYDFSFLRWLSG